MGNIHIFTCLGMTGIVLIWLLQRGSKRNPVHYANMLKKKKKGELYPLAVLYKQVVPSIFYLQSLSLLAGSSYTKTLDGLEIQVDLMLYISCV